MSDELKHEIDRITCDGCKAGLPRAKYIWTYINRALIAQEREHGNWGHTTTSGKDVVMCTSLAEKLLPLFDSIAAKAFEMAAQAVARHAAGYPINLCNLASAIRALSPASARRQLQLDLLRARLEERNKFAAEINRSGGSIYQLDIENKDHLADLESEIAALEAQNEHS